MNIVITELINQLDTTSISEERKVILHSFAEIIKTKKSKGEIINLNFICTHNSRRSHLSQIWMQTLASHFKIPTIFCYSGGTEATAIAAPVIKTLKKQGFSITQITEGTNPVYALKFDHNSPPIIGFSKEYFHDFNPKSNFTAVMTCSQADDGCPFVAGANEKIALTYEDPKKFDTTAFEEEKYAERSIQIATELYYVLSLINL